MCIWMKRIRFTNVAAVGNWQYKLIYMLVFFAIYFVKNVSLKTILLIYKTLAIKHNFKRKEEPWSGSWLKLSKKYFYKMQNQDIYL